MADINNNVNNLNAAVGEVATEATSVINRIDNINSVLGGIASGSIVDDLVTKTFESKAAFQSSQLSTLGLKVDAVQGGFMSLTQEVDNAVDTAIATNTGIAMLVENPPNLDIKKPISTLNNDLEAITEETIDGGFLNIDITAVTPEAITKALTRITGKPAEQILPAVTSISPQIAGITEQLSTSIKSFTGGIPSIMGAFSSAVSSFQTAQSGLLSNGVAQLVNGLAKDLGADIQTLNAYVKPVGGSTTVDPAAADYTYINSQLEVTSLLTSIERDITELVVGTTNTFKDQDVRASSAPGWHFIITRSGELQQGVDPNTVGSYAQNHNTNTLGIVFAGGINVGYTTGQGGGGADRYASAESLSREQYTIFDKFLKAFYAVYPHGQVLAISEIPGTNTTAPGFDVSSYIQQKFNKFNIVDVTKPAPTLSELQIQMALAATRSTAPEREDEHSEG